MKTTAYVSHFDCSRHDTGWRHPDHQGRLPAIARAVYRDMLTLFEPLLEMEGAAATADDLRLAHDEAYVAAVRERVAEAEQRSEAVSLEGDTVVSGASWDAAVAAVGTVVTAVEAVARGEVRNAFCATRPPGHGAGRARSGGYSLFNHVAVAALHARHRMGLDAVLVVDLGARPGLGSADILSGAPGVRLLMLHQERHAALDRLYEAGHAAWVPPGSDGDRVAEDLTRLLDRGLADFRPEMVLVSLGFDALASDPLGDLALLPMDYHGLTLQLRSMAESRAGGRLVSVLEDGYDPQGTAAAVVHHVRALAGLPPA